MRRIIYPIIIITIFCYRCNHPDSNDNQNIEIDSVQVLNQINRLKSLLNDVHKTEDNKRIIEILNDIKKITSFINENKINKNYLYRNDWYHTQGRMRLIDIIYEVNKTNKEFNGFHYLNNIKYLYNNDAECSQYVSGIYAKMTVQTPSKYISFIRSFKNDSIKNLFIHRPNWEIIDIQDLRDSIQNKDSLFWDRYFTDIGTMNNKKAGILYGNNYIYSFSSPDNWIIDNKSAADIGLNAVIYSVGDKWDNIKEFIYVEGYSKKENETINSFIKQDKINWKKKYTGIIIKDTMINDIRKDININVVYYYGGSYSYHVMASYADLGSSIATIVLMARSKEGIKSNINNFLFVINSFKFKHKKYGKTIL